MRELKFRVWDKRNKKWVNEHLYSLVNGEFCFQGWVFAIDDFEIMQYTGLKDKNGKDIYGEDIIRCRGLIGVVKFIDGSWVTFFTGGADILLNYVCRNSEAIGNIYENPELMESENAKS